ncbi:helix-turn-helix transcriptional regulator [Actinospica durhamensis]|uniref:Helix-turn-helix transcriptional regulator n=1 Tax=Actinospica durhamensis TaxID=1508375 RepID=A0A941EIJ9_9ACTN|nr:helix-turn-helix domain-containing protein [Actinospica durhamensis]MBR7831876.1 helix-turn-helix transcriptional regulator [Actinospica durhamensis]
MAEEVRVHIDDPEALAALAHPMRTKLLNHLISAGPATASQAARAVGDTPSNSSYHLRTLAKFGWVAAQDSADGRERPWRALVTGFDIDLAADPRSPAGRNAAALAALTLRQAQQEAREALTRFPALERAWQEATSFNAYTLRVTPDELAELTRRIDAVLRPYIAATRDARPPGAALASVAFQAFPQGPET